MKLKILIYILIIFSGAALNAAPRVDILNPHPVGYSPNVIISQTQVAANNISSWVFNTGIFNQDLRTTNTPGFMWPKGSGKFAIFTSGLCIGAYVNGTLRLATASYKGEYAPGYIDNGTLTTDSRFKVYSVLSSDTLGGPNSDYNNWGQMVPFGAPYVDKNLNGIFDQGIDLPGISNAAQTVFVCMTDGFIENHSTSEGFSGGTTPLQAQVQLTFWCYDTQGLENLQFVNWNVINKSQTKWDSTFFSVVVDPDLGDANDDYIGCDTSFANKDMAFCYNSDNQDGLGSGITYGASPPASGMDFFKSPAVFTGDPNDSVVSYVPPGSPNRYVKRGYKPLGLTSFVYFTNTGSGGATCEQDPSQPIEAYRYMTGIKKDGTPWLYPATLTPTKFCYPGDPVSGNGWSELGTNGTPNQAIVKNCGGALTGSPEASPPGDRRFIFNSGSTGFTVLPNDTQNIVLGQFVARGNTNLNSVTKLKRLDQTAQSLFDANFAVNPPPPLPKVTVSTTEASSIGTANINLVWGDTSEAYNIYDSLLVPKTDSSHLIFQGYEIFEISNFLQSLPDFNKPESINDQIALLQIYDKRDSVGTILDTLPTGATQNGSDVYATFPVVPYYTASAPPGFPNTGITRSFTITSTKFPSEHGGRSDLIYGQTYKFAVIAYANRTNVKNRDARTTYANSIGTAIITVTPEANLAGSQYTFKNGDTLFTSRRDLGVMPIIKNQSLLIDAKYRIAFNADTTYNLLRSVDNGQTFQTLKTNLRADTTKSDDSARVVDGVLVKVQKIFNNNTGVLRDPNTGTRDSLQTRLKGWEYSPPQNQFVEGSKFIRDLSRPYQSVSMSLSWPTTGTFTNVPSSITKDRLRTVMFEFTGAGNGQMAYRYLDTSSTNDNSYIYQNMVQVPFKVYEVDPTDSTATPRQLNVAFVVSNDVNPATAGWEPTADSLGGKLLTYVFNSNYDPNPQPFYTTKNLFISVPIDIMYVWAPKLISGGRSYTNGDKFYIYNYTVTRPEITPGYPLYYDFDTKKPVIGSSELAAANNDMDKIKVVPNPYYGFNELESSATNRFVTFRRLPQNCSIKIYSLNGDLIRKIDKNSLSSTQQWDLRNLEGVPVASGMYIILIDAPGIGQKIIKLAVFTPEERIDF